MPSPFKETDDEARAMAKSLLAQSTSAALGVLDPQTGTPVVTRIACVWLDADLVTLVSDLSGHTAALRAHPACSLLIGDPGPKGDPLTHPRLTLQAVATPVDKSHIKSAYLTKAPKAALWFDFSDFHAIRFEIMSGFLNGGFGKAYNLSPGDLI